MNELFPEKEDNKFDELENAELNKSCDEPTKENIVLDLGKKNITPSFTRQSEPDIQDEISQNLLNIETTENHSNIEKREKKSCEEEDTNLKQNDNGTLLSQGGEFSAEETDYSNITNYSSLKELQTTSDIRFFICGSCKNNPILIGSTPKLLPCLHSFCEKCLQERYEKQKSITENINSAPRMKCPSCGQEFLVAGNDKPTSGFLNNQFVIESTQNQGSCQVENHQCTSCDDKSPANSYCMNCNDWLCKACVIAHQRVKVTKDHIIQLQSDSPINLQNTNPKEKPLFCKIHPHEQLRLFCANCDKLTCRDCQLVEHKDHRYQFIEEAAAKHREILKKLLQYLQINLGLLKETIMEVDKASSNLCGQESLIESQINQSFDLIMNAIKARRESVLKELKTIVSGKQALLAKQKKDLTQMRIILEHNHDFAEFAVKGGSNVALLYSRKVLGTRLHNLNSLKYRQRPLALTDLKFNIDVEKLCSYFIKIGAFYSHEDIQRKIDQYNTKQQSSRHRVPLRKNNPIDSISTMNKKHAESGSVVLQTPYINLSKQGSLGIPSHKSRRSNSPSSYNINAYRLPPSAHQDMIVLSSSNPISNSTVSRIDGARLQQSRTPLFGANPVSPAASISTANQSSRNQLSSPLQKIPSLLEKNEQHSHLASHSLPCPSLDFGDQSCHSKSNESTVEGVHQQPIHSTCSPNSIGNRQCVQGDNAIFIKEEQVSPVNQAHYLIRKGMHNQDVNRCTSDFDDNQNNEDYCGVCRNGGQLLCCDTCPKVYHLQCHIPTMTDLPSDSWSCGLCTDINSWFVTTGTKRRPLELSNNDLQVCQKLLLRLFTHCDSLPFQHKVSKSQAPDYYKVINKPMDLHTILTKLNPQHFQHYKCVEEFVADVRLILNNCFIYNSKESEVYNMGRRLEQDFERSLSQVSRADDQGVACKRKKSSPDE